MRSILVKALQRLGGYGWFASAAAHWAPRTDLWLHRRTGGKRMFLSLLFPVLVVTTTGRKTGLPRPTPLLALDDPEGGGHLVVGSNFGLRNTPAWALNLLADPEATIERDGAVIKVTARLLEGPERARAWEKLAAAWPAYHSYVSRAHREFALFRLLPTA